MTTNTFDAQKDRRIKQMSVKAWREAHGLVNTTVKPTKVIVADPIRIKATTPSGKFIRR